MTVAVAIVVETFEQELEQECKSAHNLKKTTVKLDICLKGSCRDSVLTDLLQYSAFVWLSNRVFGNRPSSPQCILG